MPIVLAGARRMRGNGRANQGESLEAPARGSGDPPPGGRSLHPSAPSETKQTPPPPRPEFELIYSIRRNMARAARASRKLLCRGGMAWAPGEGGGGSRNGLPCQALNFV